MRDPRNRQRRQAQTPPVILAAGALILLVVGLLIHHFRNSGANGAPPAPREVVAWAYKPNAGGSWIARSGPSGQSNAAAARGPSEAQNAGNTFETNDNTRARGDARRSERGTGWTLPNPGMQGTHAGSSKPGQDADAPGIEVAATVPVPPLWWEKGFWIRK